MPENVESTTAPATASGSWLVPVLAAIGAFVGSLPGAYATVRASDQPDRVQELSISCDLEDVNATQEIGVNYVVFHEGDDAGDYSLGAQVRSRSHPDIVITDPDSDISLPDLQGRSERLRFFSIPPDLPPGRYTLIGQVWSGLSPGAENAEIQLEDYCPFSWPR